VPALQAGMAETFPSACRQKPTFSLALCPFLHVSLRGPRLRGRGAWEDLPGLTRKSANGLIPPCQHGQARRKAARYAIARRKESFRFNYGISERQLVRYVKRKARAQTAPRNQPAPNCLRIARQHLLPPRFRAHGSGARQLGQPWSRDCEWSCVDIPSIPVPPRRPGSLVAIARPAAKLAEGNLNSPVWPTSPQLRARTRPSSSAK